MKNNKMSEIHLTQIHCLISESLGTSIVLTTLSIYLSIYESKYWLKSDNMKVAEKTWSK